jgi:hypothetical protein
MKLFKLAEERGGAEYEALADRIAMEGRDVTFVADFGQAMAWGVAQPDGVSLTVLTEVEEHDGKDWWHISVSARVGKAKASRVPTYDELCWVKRVFIGKDAMAIQVFPRACEHVNIHSHCLHLWAPIGHSPLPDFRWSAGEGVFGV